MGHPRRSRQHSQTETRVSGCSKMKRTPVWFSTGVRGQMVWFVGSSRSVYLLLLDLSQLLVLLVEFRAPVPKIILILEELNEL